jgi:hypothetical protein
MQLQPRRLTSTFSLPLRTRNLKAFSSSSTKVKHKKRHKICIINNTYLFFLSFQPFVNIPVTHIVTAMANCCYSSNFTGFPSSDHKGPIKDHSPLVFSINRTAMLNEPQHYHYSKNNEKQQSVWKGPYCLETPSFSVMPTLLLTVSVVTQCRLVRKYEHYGEN